MRKEDTGRIIGFYLSLAKYYRDYFDTYKVDTLTTISLSELELKFANADRSTLFRTLKTFEDKKLIHSIDDGTGSLKYALCKSACTTEHIDKHIHFFCLKCEQTFCLVDFEIPDFNLPVDFSLDSVNIIAKGICANCKS